jgi:tRNA-modifying protein YgfZ
MMAAQLICAALNDRALVSVAGPDWRRFLQGLLSNDVEALGQGEARFAALLTPQGKFLFDMFVLTGEDGCLLDVQAVQRDDLIRRLVMYRLRSKVEIAPRDGVVSALWPASDASPDPGWTPDPRLAALGWRGIGVTPPAGAAIASADDYDAHRLSLGVPDPARDCTPDKTYPIEADFDLLGGIDFQKGCYVGQETTSRMKRRGTIKTRMLPVAFDGPPPPFGTEVLAGALRAGEVLSGREGRAMALLRLDRITGGDLTVDDRAVEVEFPPWFPSVSRND